MPRRQGKTKRVTVPSPAVVEVKVSPPTIHGVPIRYGYPFRSVEQQFEARVGPYSNFEGGFELDERMPNIGEARSCPSSSDAARRPAMNRLVKPRSGDRAQ